MNICRHILCTGLLLAHGVSSVAAAAVEDPDQWYRNAYGVLWADQPATHIDAMLTHYADQVTTLGADGSISVEDKQTWLAEPMMQWLDEGWVAAQLALLQTDSINATTAVFKALWVDQYSNGPDELSCGWYLANYMDDKWQFTHYADLDCEEHGLSLR